MERLWRSLLPQDSELSTDGKTDNTDRSAEGNTLSVSSSSREWIHQVISSVYVDPNSGLLAGSRSSLYAKGVHFDVRPSCCGHSSLNNLIKPSRRLRQSKVDCTHTDQASTFKSSLVCNDTGDQISNNVITSSLAETTVSIQELISLPGITAFIDTTERSDNLQLKYDIPGVHGNISYTSLALAAALSDIELINDVADDHTKLKVVFSSDILFEKFASGRSEAVSSDYSNKRTLSEVLPTLHVTKSSTESPISIFTIINTSSNSAQTDTLTLAVPTRELYASLIVSTVQQYDGIILSASEVYDSTIVPTSELYVSTTVSTFEVFVNSIVPTSEVYESIPVPTSEVYNRSTSTIPELFINTVPTRGLFSNTVPTREVYVSIIVPTSDIYGSTIVSISKLRVNSSVPYENSQKSAAAIPTLKLANLKPAEISRAVSVLVGLVDVSNSLELDTPQLTGSHPWLLSYTETVAYLTPGDSFETLGDSFEPVSQNEQRGENRELLLSSYRDDVPSNVKQKLDLISINVVTSTSDTFAFRDSLSSSHHTYNGGSLIPSYRTYNGKSELFWFSDRVAPFTSEGSVYVGFFPLTFSVTDNENNMQRDSQNDITHSQSGIVDEDSPTVDIIERAAGLFANQVSISVSPVNELPTRTEDFDSLSGNNEINQLSEDSVRSYSSTMENSIMFPTYLQPSSTIAYFSSFHYTQLTTRVAAKDDVDFQAAETSTDQHLSSQISIFSSTISEYSDSGETTPPLVYPALTVDLTPTLLSTSEICNGISCPSSRMPGKVYTPGTLYTTSETPGADGGTSSRQMPNFNTTIIIASACAVLAVVILVIIAIFCLRRKKRVKSPAPRQQGDDLWVDLYRSSSSHQMPLPSLMNCSSAFEMTDVLKQPGTAQDMNGDQESSLSSVNSPQVNQVKPPAQRHVSSFQIKKPNPEIECELGLTCPPIELEVPDTLGQAECWVNMTTSVSMMSLPTTDVSYNTNVTDYNLAAVGHKFRAVYAYKPVCKGEMALKEGELIVCKERDRNGWMFGSKPRTQEEGWFPAVYVDEISSDYELDFNCDIPETYDILESNKLHSVDQYWTGIEHKVWYSYDSSVPGDLNVEPGQTVTVLLTLANGWWFAVSGSSCGWFPGSYVEMIVDNSTVNINAENSVVDISILQEKGDAKQTGNNETAIIADSNNVSLKLTSHAENENCETNILVEPGTPPDIKSTKSKSTLTPHMLTPDKPETLHKLEITTNSTSSSSLTKKSTQNGNRPGKLLRPARPAPPPPNRKDCTVRKDSLLSTEGNKPQVAVHKKPIVLIQGKRPKLQKVLRSQLDDKQLNPMIRPSTRGFIPKPTAHTENRLMFANRYDNHRDGDNSNEHSNSSPSIADDFHNELMTLLSQAQETDGVISPLNALNFRPIFHNDGRSSSRTSLESGSDSRLAYPITISDHRQTLQEQLPNTEYNEMKYSKTLVNNLSRARSLTPDYKKDKSNSPILLTSGNLLQNVQRFHGALSHPSPSPSLDSEKGTVKVSHSGKGTCELISRNTPPNSFNQASRRLRTPTTVSPPQVPSINSPRSKSPYSTQPDQGSNPSQQNVQLNSESSNKLEAKVIPLVTFMPVQPVTTDENSNRENSTGSNGRSFKLLKPDITVLNRDSLVVAPGTVSDIVHQINKQTPL